MNTKPILEKNFYRDGRDPELQNTIWSQRGTVLVGFEYYNPDDVYEEAHLKNIELVGIEAFSMSSNEVHGNILLATNESNAAILEVVHSEWLMSFNQSHLSDCKHYQIMFYDEIYDVVCKTIRAGTGNLNSPKKENEGIKV